MERAPPPGGAVEVGLVEALEAVAGELVEGALELGALLRGRVDRRILPGNTKPRKAEASSAGTRKTIARANQPPSDKIQSLIPATISLRSAG